MINHATEANLQDCFNVMQLSYKVSSIEQGFPNRGRVNLYEQMLADWKNGDLIYYVSHNEVIVGMLRMQKFNDESCKIKDIAVLPEYQRKGYGKELLDYAKIKAKKLGYVKVELGMFDDNIALKDWYIKNGFISARTTTFEDSQFGSVRRSV